MDIPDRNMTSSNRYSKQPELNLIDYEKVFYANSVIDWSTIMQNR